MFYTLDFTRTRYRRRKAVRAGYGILALMFAGALCLLFLRLTRMIDAPTLDERLQACHGNVQNFLQFVDNWTGARQEFGIIMPFWHIDTASNSPSDFLQTVLANAPAWQHNLTPRRLAVTANRTAEIDLELWFQDAPDKAVVIEEASQAIKKGLADWSPAVTVENRGHLAGRDRTGVKIRCHIPPHRWPQGMESPTPRITALTTGISNFHAAVWSIKPLPGGKFNKNTDLAAAVNNALVKVNNRLATKDGEKSPLSEWQVVRQRVISPSAFFLRLRRDLRQRGFDVPEELDHAEDAWRRLAGCWWRRPRTVDWQALAHLEAETAAIMNMRVPPPQTFAGFAEWMTQYRAAFTNAWTSQDIRINGRDRTRLKALYREVVPVGDDPSIECRERPLPVPVARIGYSDWTLRPNHDNKAAGGDMGLPMIVHLARKLERPDHGIRLITVEINFKERQALSGAWEAEPESSLLKGLLPWQAPSPERKAGEQP